MKIMLMHFRLNYFDKNNHIERLPVSVKSIDNLFRKASEILESDELHLFLISERQ